jgi:hypothetical protein
MCSRSQDAAAQSRSRYAGVSVRLCQCLVAASPLFGACIPRPVSNRTGGRRDVPLDGDPVRAPEPAPKPIGGASSGVGLLKLSRLWPSGPAPGLGGLRRGAGGVGRLVWRVRSGGGLPTLSELATMLGLSRAESVPNLTRRFGAWLAIDAKIRKQLEDLEKELDGSVHPK